MSTRHKFTSKQIGREWTDNHLPSVVQLKTMCEIVHFAPIIQYTKILKLLIPMKSVNESNEIECDRIIDTFEIDFSSMLSPFK